MKTRTRVNSEVAARLSRRSRRTFRCSPFPVCNAELDDEEKNTELFRQANIEDLAEFLPLRREAEFRPEKTCLKRL